MWPFAKKLKPGFPPVPEWKPDIPVDIERTVKTFAYYSGFSVRFAVFGHGTCIAVGAEVADLETAVSEILGRIYHQHPDFRANEMDDGHIMVTYSQNGAASIVFADEYEANREYIEQNFSAGLVPDEVLTRGPGGSGAFEPIDKAGLLGRARMFLDAQHPVIVHKWAPGDP